MELYATSSQFIVMDGKESLWIDRHTGGHEAKSGVELEGVHCLGTVYGYLGKLKISQASETRLVFIRQQVQVGKLRGIPIYKIASVVTIPLESECELVLEACPKSFSNGNCQPVNCFLDANTFTTHSASSSLSNLEGQAQSPSHGPISTVDINRPMVKVRVTQSRGYHGKKTERSDKLERRMLDECYKMFTEADSFYYSPKLDLSNSMQRQHGMFKSSETCSDDVICKLKAPSLWEQFDPRFFWNAYMLESLINSKDKKLNPWILPIIQGFVQFDTCTIDQSLDRIGAHDQPVRGSIELWLISRRSKYQAGTRYLRRGIDETGKVANFVETEQIIVFKNHLISFVQVRGSIPVFWSQSNRYRYRPPPKVEREPEETYKAFKKHFDEQQSIYQQVVIINLVEKSGKEKVLGDCFLDNVMRHDCQDLTYVTFDFHESCRGMKFDKVSVLIDKLGDIMKTMNYSWIDSYGSVLKQDGVFRVNCVDCLDRTNVVQTHIAKEILTTQLGKLGLLLPEVGLTANIRQALQTLWANNGDTISKQYAGTNALKGDFTRTGERKISGVMKDGMNSANRYYLNRFKDTSRQAAIDLMLGVRKTVTEDDLDEKQPFDKENTPEQIRNAIEDIKKTVIPPDEIVLGSWGLVNAKISEPDSIDIDAILILTESNYYVIDYEGEENTTEETQKINLSYVEGIELGFDPLMQPTTFWNIFNSGNNPGLTLVPNMRINYHQPGGEKVKQLSHEFRSSNIRFFNNVPIPIQHPEEMLEALRMIAEGIKIAVVAHGREIDVRQTTPPMLKDFNTSGSKGRIPSVASGWVNKYFLSNQNQVGPADAAVLAKKISAASIERFTPKYFRRGSNASVNNNGGGGTAIITRSPHGATIITDSEKPPSSCTSPPKAMLQLSPYKLHLKVCSPSSASVVDLINFTCDFNNDLLLPSCGILSPGRRPHSLSHVHQAPPQSPSPFSDSQDTLGESPTTAPPLVPPTISNILFRHRYSLPGNSLTLTLPSSQASPTKRCKTPEITITEENLPFVEMLIPSSSSSAATAPSQAMRRLSRSSDDVNRSINPPSNHQRNIFKLPSSLFTSGGGDVGSKSSATSRSQQNIFDSSNMRGSHSDNALGENPHQQPQQQSAQKVLAPFGKFGNLAFRGMQNIGVNYLDPRKLRDSFTKGAGSGTTVDNSSIVKDKEREERKSSCKTVFIDV